MRNKLPLLVLIGILVALAAPMALAEGEFELHHQNIKTNVLEGEVARFNLSIQSNVDFDDRFQISVEDVRWSPTLEPLTDYTYGMQVTARQKNTSLLTLVPSKSLRVGEYSIRIDAYSKETKKVYSDVVQVYVGQMILLNPDLTIAAFIDNEIDPRKPVKLKVVVHNKNELELNNVTLSVKSTLFSEERKIDIDANQSLTFDYSFELDPLVQPRDDMLVVSAMLENKVLSFSRKDLKVIEYSTALEKTITEVSDFFFKNVNQIEVLNNGNVARSETVRYAMPLRKRMFSSTSPKAETIEEDGIVYYAWNVELDPDESIKIKVTTSYRFLFIVLILAAAGLALYFYLRIPLVVEKDAQILERREGGISLLKIFVHVKNRSRKHLGDIHITDIVPELAIFVRDNTPGTLAPSKIIAKGRASVIEWKLPRFDPYEERIISYRIKSKLSILGDLHLRKAKVRFKFNKAEYSSYSNPISLDEKDDR